MTFQELGLRTELLKAVKSLGYPEPTPIQTQAIPVILKGQDILARAQTGTGKTDAFALPLVEILSQKEVGIKQPRALVLVPTRELARQVGETIKGYARRVSLRCTVVHGGVRLEPQIDRIKRGIDILVATPGRLIELSKMRHLKLDRIEFLVFDEADRMLDLGFSREINQILGILPEKRRTMLFSATYTAPIRELASRMLQAPAHIEVSPENTAAEPVIQRAHKVDRHNKQNLLNHLIKTEKWSQILVFARTRRGADKITEKCLAKGVQAAVLHSSKSQSLRSRTLEEFKQGVINVLVATDVAARGLDIKGLPCVINYDIPSVAEDYLHRIGRTGRAGVQGLALSFVSEEEERFITAIETHMGEKIPAKKIKGYTLDSDVPDYVLYRPGSSSSEKKAKKEFKEMAEKRKNSKRMGPTKKAKSGTTPKKKKSPAKGASKARKRR